MNSATYSPGLEGVIGGRTAICAITDEGLSYRGYMIQDLAESATYEEVAYLLLMGELPSVRQLAAFRRQLGENRDLPGACLAFLERLPADAPPMDVLRTGVSMLAHHDPETGDNSHEANVRKAVRLLARIPALIGARQRLSQGREVLEPDPAASQAATLLTLTTGEPGSALAVRVLDVSLVLYAEHEFNASTFAGRVTVSTLSDLHSGIVSAIGALKGPLHGGANERSMETMLAARSPENAEAWVMAALARRERIMGFGHRVLRQGDSRATILRDWGHRLVAAGADDRWQRIADTIEAVMAREKGLHPNVDFPCGWVYYTLGLPVSVYTPIFVASRTAGWAAHLIEQLDDNRLIRPRSEYLGPPPPRPFVPLEARPD